MPQLSDLVEKRKFVKKEYRAWDLSGTGTVDGKEPSTKPDELATTAISLKPCLVSEEKALVQETLTNYETGQTSPQLLDNKTDNITGNNQITNGEHADNIKITKRKQPDNIKVTMREQPGNKTDNITSNNEELAYLIESIKKLSGIQKNIFFYVLNICSARSALNTGNILSSDLANAANCTIGSAKMSLIRLVQKHLVLRFRGKASRGGHMVLGITKEIQSASIQAQQALFNPFKIAQIDNITGNITDNIGHSSSSIYKNNTTTSLPEDWKKINFEVLRHLGFSETQLRQLYESNTTSPEIVQDAINRFAYSLEHSDKVKAYNDPLNVLMGVLRKGQRWVEPNYVSPKELALRQLLEEKRKQKEQYDAMVKELIELEFPDWRRKLTDEDIKQIVPDDIRKTNLSAAIQATLRTFFVEKVLLPRLDVQNDS